MIKSIQNLNVIHNAYFRENNMIVSDRARMLLYQIMNTAVELTEAEINNIFGEIDCSTEENSQFKLAIKKYQLNGSHLMLKKRHSVLLILDEV